MAISKRSIKPIPAKNPTTAGNHAKLPIACDSSIAGMRSDHTDAATITPEAKPSNGFCSDLACLSLNSNTAAEPRMVPTKGSISSGSISKLIIIIFTVTKIVLIFRFAKQNGWRVERLGLKVES